MKVNFIKLKQKDVINLTDGKNLGKVCDLTFTFPEAEVEGITVTGGKGFRFNKTEVYIPIERVKKIGQDAVLVSLNKEREKPDHDKGEHHKPYDPCDPCKPYDPCRPNNRRSLDEYE